jgi:phosphoribosyl-dephospho-CoA transferase
VSASAATGGTVAAGALTSAATHAVPGLHARPHDLLFCDLAGVRLPAWATREWLARAPLVMRRESVLDPDCIPVGLRGHSRSLRHKDYVSALTVTRRLSPESLAAALETDTMAGLKHGFESFFALQALAEVAPMLADTGLVWGPTGGVGFALACALPVLRPDSDLDLLVRADAPLTAAQHRLLQRICAVALCRIDMQIDTGYGGFAFSEWARVRGRSSIMLKTDAGPLLTDDPWRRTGTAA